MDGSPSIELKKQMLPGQSWAGNGIGVKSEIDFNTDNEDVHIWTLGFSASIYRSLHLLQFMKRVN
jgi:hypothetical protein